MGERIKHTGDEIKDRWSQKMPRFFRQLVVVCVCVAGTAFGINTMLTISGAIAHEWWTNIYPLLIGVPTGMAIVCKLTVAGGYKDIDPDKLTRHNPILDKDIDHMHGEQPSIYPHPMAHPREFEPQEIEPYNDGPNA